MKIILYAEKLTRGNELEGQPAETWVRIWQEWFDVKPLTGREYVLAQQVKSTVTHQLRCVYRSGANSELRLTAGADAPTRIFNVESVVNVGENNRELEWMVQEVT